jgi:hypothetical protein
MATSSAYAVRSTTGPLVLAGTDTGEVAVFELLSDSLFKTLRTGEAGPGGRPPIVTAIAVHPSMSSATGTGEDIIYVGHSDGTVKAVRLSKGDTVATFTAPEVEHLGPGGAAAAAGYGPRPACWGAVLPTPGGK